MTSHDDDRSIDFKKLEKELDSAVDADARYWRENDAKFRAVNQKVGSYDEFRDMVKASHIKPLEKEDRLTDIQFNQPWNSQASKKEIETSKQETQDIPKRSSVLKTNQEFLREWRPLNRRTAEQYAFLLDVGGEQLEKIFKMEISFGLLGDFVNCMNAEFKDEDAASILAILDHLSKANRFSLTVQFLSSKEKQTCESLFDQLERWKKEQTDDFVTSVSEMYSNLLKLYEIKK